MALYYQGISLIQQFRPKLKTDIISFLPFEAVHSILQVYLCIHVEMEQMILGNIETCKLYKFNNMLNSGSVIDFIKYIVK